MRISTLKELVLYRYRHAIGYILLISFSLLLTTWQISSIPPGFSSSEITSAVAAQALTKDSSSFSDAPYLLIQKASLHVFGPSAIGVRLPSILLALVLAIAAYVVFRLWFGENMAIIGTILIITASHFLLRSRTGSPMLMYSLWTAVLLASASLTHRLRRGQKLWFWLFAVSAALSLYTPLFGILLLTIVVVIAVSRQSRGLVNEVGQAGLSLAVFSFVALLVPLGYSIYRNPAVALQLVGASVSDATQLHDRALYLVQTLFVTDPTDVRILVPTLSLPAVALLAYGIYRSLRRFGRLKHAVAILLLTVSCALYIAVPEAPPAITFLPLMLLVVIGLQAFINNWYRLFPRNPYARILALLPLALLVMVMVQFNYNRYFYGLARSENVRKNYDGDMLLLVKRLRKQPVLQSGTLVVADDQKAFYQLLDRPYPNLKVVTSHDITGPASGVIIVADSQQTAVAANLPDVTPQFLADDRPGDALRFRVYRQ